MAYNKANYNLSYNLHENKPNKTEDCTTSRQEANPLRKILQATRYRNRQHTENSKQNNHPTSSSPIAHSIKRRASDSPERPSKKIHITSTTNIRHNKSPKNLADRRLQNLRKSLEEQRRQGKYAKELLTLDKAKNYSNVLIPPVSSFQPKETTYSPISDRKNDRRNSNGGRSSTYKISSLPQRKSPIQDRLHKYKSPRKDVIIIGNILRNDKLCTDKSPITSTATSLKWTEKVEKKEILSETIGTINSVETINSSTILTQFVNVPENSVCESMEWSAVDEETLVENINELRKEMTYGNNLPINTVLNNSNTTSNLPGNSGVHIVVDTNIFLLDIPFLTQLRDAVFEDFGRVTIVVPWMVIQELDYMKESNNRNSLSKGARRAVNFINDQLTRKHPQFKGQTVLEASNQDLSSKNADDGILFCCLQLVDQGKCVVLLSNDTNLRNKVLVNNIRAYTKLDIITNLKNFRSSQCGPTTELRSVQKIKILLSNMLTHIIEAEMKNAFGDVWHKMAKMQAPYTTEEALQCLFKYWQSVFSFSLQKQCGKKIEEFNNFMKLHRTDDNYEVQDFNKFIEHSLSLCIYLKNGYTDYRDIVTDCIQNLQKCAE